MKVLTRSSCLKAIVSFAFAVPALFAQSEEVIIQTDALAVTLSSKGAELQSIRHIPTDTEYLWQGDPSFWSARAPNMFPVNVRFKDNKYTYKGQPYQMPFLGLAVSADFETKSNDGNRVLQVFDSSPETLRHYPFPFRLEIASVINELTLSQTYTVRNTGSETLYFALGGHPGFRTPLNDRRQRSDYQLRFSKKMDTVRAEVVDGTITGKRIPYLSNEDRLTLSDPRVPNAGMLLLNHDSRQIGLSLGDRPPYVTVDLGDFPNTNIWTPPGMPYACIEPMVTHHDFTNTSLAIEEKSYLAKLPAGESRTYTYTITINPTEGARALK